MKTARSHRPCLNPQVARRENVFTAPHKSQIWCRGQQDAAATFIFSSGAMAPSETSSLSSAEPFTLYLLMSLSIYPWLMHSARIVNSGYLNLNLLIAPSLFPVSLCSRWSRWQPVSLAVFNPSFRLSMFFCFFSSIHPQHRASAVKSLSVCVCSGRSDDHCSARRQLLCLDRWHFQPMVVHGRLWGGEKKCLREKHVCLTLTGTASWQPHMLHTQK